MFICGTWIIKMEDIECCHDHDFVVLTDVIEDGTTPILILALFSSEK